MYAGSYLPSNGAITVNACVLLCVQAVSSSLSRPASVCDV